MTKESHEQCDSWWCTDICICIIGSEVTIVRLWEQGNLPAYMVRELGHNRVCTTSRTVRHCIFARMVGKQVLDINSLCLSYMCTPCPSTLALGSFSEA